MDERELIESEIRSLEADLQSNVSNIGDWKISKCYEYKLVGLEPPYDIDELHAKRESVRERIRELQAQLDKLNN